MKNNETIKNTENITERLETVKQESVDYLLKEIEKISILKFGK